MVHFVAGGGVIILGVLLLTVFQRRFTPKEQKYIWGGFGAHVVAAFAQVLITRYYYGGGDMLAYHSVGTQLAEWMTVDFFENSYEVLRFLLHQTDVSFPFYVLGGGESTGSMFAVSGFLSLFLGGSIYAICLAVSFFAYCGQLALYLGLRDMFLARYRKRLLVAALLIPTVVYWSGGLLKETFAIGGFGLLFLGVQRFIYGNFGSKHALIVGFGGAVVALFKAYVLFPFFLAAGVWFYWERSLKQNGRVAVLSKPLYMVAGICIAVAAIMVLGELFPRYSPGKIGEELVEVQHNQLQVQGGSNIDVPTPAERGFAAQLSLVPWALTAVLLRPFIFEAHNVVALVNSLETTIILMLIVWILIARGPRTVYRTIAGSPGAVFCVVFVLLFGTAVGLAAPNLGTLSRYRIPMMPFYVGLLVLLAPMKN